MGRIGSLFRGRSSTQLWPNQRGKLSSTLWFDSVWIRPPLPIPDFQPLSLTDGLFAADGQSEYLTQNLLNRVCTKFPAGLCDGFAEDNEAPSLLQREAKNGLFCGKQRFIESANRMKCGPGTEQEAAARQTEYPVNGVCHRFQRTGIERQPSFKVKCAAAARSAMEHRLDRCPPHSNNRGSMLLSNGRGPVRRCIIHNQNFSCTRERAQAFSASKVQPSSASSL